MLFFFFFSLCSPALIKLMNRCYGCVTAAEFGASNYDIGTNQERQQSANPRGSINAVLDVWKYLCVLPAVCRAGSPPHWPHGSRRQNVGGRKRLGPTEDGFIKWSWDLYSNIFAELGENGKFTRSVISVQLSSQKSIQRKFKFVKFHQLKPDSLRIPCADLGWVMKEWWQRDKPKG